MLKAVLAVMVFASFAGVASAASRPDCPDANNAYLLMIKDADAPAAPPSQRAPRVNALDESVDDGAGDETQNGAASGPQRQQAEEPAQRTELARRNGGGGGGGGNRARLPAQVLPDQVLIGPAQRL